MHIRWMIRNDMDAVLEIENLCFPDYPWDREVFIEHLRQRNVIGMVVEIGDEVVGFMIYSLAKEFIEIYNFAVHPSCWRRGVGVSMIDKLHSKLRPDRRTKIRARIHDGNLNAQLFFRYVGFRAVSVANSVYHNGDDAYDFEFDLLDWSESISRPEVRHLQG